MATQVPEDPPAAPVSASGIRSFHQVGDEGVTATIGSSGLLMQISRHFNDQRTGFCVDHRDAPEPYQVMDRVNRLIALAESDSATDGVGASFPSSISWPEKPSVEYVHDRWPTFAFKSKNGFKITLQYMVHRGTLYQIYDYDWRNCNDPTEVASLTQPLVFSPQELLIRDLDFVDGSNKFNEAKFDDKRYFYQNVQDKLFIREHTKSVRGGPEERVSLGVELKTFLDQDSIQTTNAQDETTKPYKPDTTSPPDKPQTSRTRTTILAYTLTHTKVSDDIPIMFRDFTDPRKELLQKPYCQQTFCKDQRLNFCLRRNLEHILSVCSIPTYKTSRHEDTTAVAITCGDFDGHRVSTAASFYCFQFLLLALEHFKRQRGEDCPCKAPCYVCTMRKRIKGVCAGHIEWLFQHAERPGGTFSTHYWVNGERIHDLSYLPGRSLVDVPFQLIKAGDFYKTSQDWLPKTNPESGKSAAPIEFPSGTLRLVGAGITPTVKSTPSVHNHVQIAGDRSSEGDIRDVIETSAKAWVQDLDGRNKLGMFAFPRYDDEKATNTFYLTDHAVIWQALKALESMDVKLDMVTPQDNSKARVYTSKVVQQNIIKRFTTQNPVSQKKMLAVSRTPSNTRFYFRTKDAALFRAVEKGLFDESSLSDAPQGRWDKTIEVWKNTVDCQKLHQDNDDMDWNEPLRFALSIVMAHNQKSINTRAPEDMSEYALEFLLERSSDNGLFPGRLDEQKWPSVYKDEYSRDNFWGVTFEVPYLLWKHSSSAGERPKPDKGSQKTSPKDNEKSHGHHQTYFNGQILSLLKDLTQQTRAKNDKKASSSSMKRHFPFSNTIELQNIVELEDEWLYNEPIFFNQNALKTLETTNDTPSLTVVIDVPKAGKGAEARQKDAGSAMLSRVSTTGKLTELTRSRTPKSAKKRLWAMFSAGCDEITHCENTAGSDPITQHQMANFHQSHKSFEKHFEEETVAELNTWTTELHLSFYDILVGNKSQKEQQDTGDLSLPPTETRPVDTFLTRVSTSFHIEGDFFDRYWTCRYWELDQHWKTSGSSHANSLGEEDVELLLAEVEAHQPTTPNDNVSTRVGGFIDRVRTLHNRHVSTSYLDRWELSTETEMDIRRAVIEVMTTLMLKNEKEPTDGHLQKGPWQQRRVLELLLVRRILKKMLKSSDRILGVARSSIKKVKLLVVEHDKQGDLDKLDFNEFRIARRCFQQVQDVLQTVEGDLAGNLAQMELWRTREKDRQAEKPRWTLNDENRYRAVIVKLRVSNEHDVQKLKRIHLQIASLNELLGKKLELMRNDLEQRRANDIQKFTYVTVVFLPLGFATGVFSMSGAPASQTLVSMVFTAIVSLVVTALMLGVTQAFDSRTLIRWRKQAIEAASGFPERLLTTQKKLIADPERADA